MFERNASGRQNSYVKLIAKSLMIDENTYLITCVLQRIKPTIGLLLLLLLLRSSSYSTLSGAK